MDAPVGRGDGDHPVGGVLDADGGGGGAGQSIGWRELPRRVGGRDLETVRGHDRQLVPAGIECHVDDGFLGRPLDRVPRGPELGRLGDEHGAVVVGGCDPPRARRSARGDVRDRGAARVVDLARRLTVDGVPHADDAIRSTHDEDLAIGLERQVDHVGADVGELPASVVVLEVDHLDVVRGGGRHGDEAPVAAGGQARDLVVGVEQPA